MKDKDKKSVKYNPDMLEISNSNLTRLKLDMGIVKCDKGKCWEEIVKDNYNELKKQDSYFARAIDEKIKELDEKEKYCRIENYIATYLLLDKEGIIKSAFMKKDNLSIGLSELENKIEKTYERLKTKNSPVVDLIKSMNSRKCKGYKVYYNDKKEIERIEIEENIDIKKDIITAYLLIEQKLKEEYNNI
jgi:hypothetical protein